MTTLSPPQKTPNYHFGGPFGTAFITIFVTLFCWAVVFGCNGTSGCPTPSLLHPASLNLEKLKEEVNWRGVTGLVSIKAFSATLGYYALSLVLNAMLPAKKVQGVELNCGGRLTYHFNAFNSALFILAVAAAGTAVQGAYWSPWLFISENYVQIMTSNIIISYIVATYVYIASFSVRPNNNDKRELAVEGNTGSIVHDWFIGRELNPRMILPFVGEIDIKTWFEMRPGMLGWFLLDCAFIAEQRRNHGVMTNSIVLTTMAQAYYIFDGLWNEPALVTTVDVIAEGFGFMLSFGDIVWVPFTFSLPARYLAFHPVQLGPVHASVTVLLFVLGMYIFRASNSEKNIFRTNPDDPRVKHLKYIETASGRKLLISGWWGTARHINYLGDWMLSWAYCLPTGLAGYVVDRSAGDSSVATVSREKAMGWGMIVTYFYLFYFAVLLVHRALKDDHKCRKKYGKDWERYCELVPWRIIPGVY